MDVKAVAVVMMGLAGIACYVCASWLYSKDKDCTFIAIVGTLLLMSTCGQAQ